MSDVLSGCFAAEIYRVISFLACGGILLAPSDHLSVVSSCHLAHLRSTRVLIKVKSCVMELQVRELRCVARCRRLLVLSGRADVVRVVCGPVVVMLSAEMRNYFATSWSGAGRNYDGLMLAIPSSCRACSFSHRVSVMVILACVRRVVYRFVPPVSRVESTLWALILLGSRLLATRPNTSVCKVSRYRLNGCVIEACHLLSSLMAIVLAAGHDRFHHQVVSLHYGRVYDSSELLVVSHCHLTSAEPPVTVPLMLRAVDLRLLR